MCGRCCVGCDIRMVPKKRRMMRMIPGAQTLDGTALVSSVKVPIECGATWMGLDGVVCSDKNHTWKR